MRKILSYLAVILFLIFMGVNHALAATNLDEGVSQLAGQISKSMQDKQKQKIAIIDFSDLNGNVTALGQFMAEELTTQLFIIAPGKFEVVERRQLLKVEEELTLGQTGFIEEKSIKKMGQVLGVDAIVTGSMTDLGNTVKINARLIAVESAKVIAVAATAIPKTGIVADLITKQKEGKGGVTQPAQTANAPVRQEVKGEAKQEAKYFLFELQGCKASGRDVTCNLLITNKGDDRELSLLGGTRIFDDKGNEYTINEYELGTDKGHLSPSFETQDILLVSDVPAKASVSFEKVSKGATKITLLELGLGGEERFKVQFRDIPLSR